MNFQRQLSEPRSIMVESYPLRLHSNIWIAEHQMNPDQEDISTTIDLFWIEV